MGGIGSQILLLLYTNDVYEKNYGLLGGQGWSGGWKQDGFAHSCATVGTSSELCHHHADSRARVLSELKSHLALHNNRHEVVALWGAYLFINRFVVNTHTKANANSIEKEICTTLAVSKLFACPFLFCREPPPPPPFVVRFQFVFHVVLATWICWFGARGMSDRMFFSLLCFFAAAFFGYSVFRFFVCFNSRDFS